MSLNILECPQPSMKYLSECLCTRMRSESPLASSRLTDSEPQNGRLHCTKEAEFTHHSHDAEGHCRTTSWRGSVTCEPLMKEHTSALTHPDPCIDSRPTEWCEEAAKTGACKEAAFQAVSGLFDGYKILPGYQLI